MSSWPDILSPSGTCGSAWSAHTARWRASLPAPASASGSSTGPTGSGRGRGPERHRDRARLPHLPGRAACPATATASGAARSSSTAPEGETRADGGCVACGAPAEAIGADGYCSRCGARQRAPQDREEIDLAVAAGVSDRGRVHRRNEDAFTCRASVRPAWLWWSATGSPHRSHQTWRRGAPRTPPEPCSPQALHDEQAVFARGDEKRGARRAAGRARGALDVALGSRRPLVHAGERPLPRWRAGDRLGRRQPRLLDRSRGPAPAHRR